MEYLLNCKIYWVILLITILGEFFIPFVLSKFYKDYDSKYMVMSVLGNKNSPINFFYNIWLIFLGILFIITSIVLFELDKNNNLLLAAIELIIVLIFGIGAGIISDIFSVNETKSTKSLSSIIHGICSSLGFMALLLLPIIKGILYLKDYYIIGIINIIAFILAIVFFTLFIMADKKQFRNTIIAYEGLWQRLTLLFMYVPLICQSIIMLIK